jgi:hypothetical protein
VTGSAYEIGWRVSELAADGSPQRRKRCGLKTLQDLGRQLLMRWMGKRFWPELVAARALSVAL